MDEIKQLNNKIDHLTKLVEKLIRYKTSIWYIKGTGHHGIPRKPIYAGTLQDCQRIVTHTLQMEYSNVSNTDFQFYPRGQVGGNVAGHIKRCAVTDELYDELFAMADLLPQNEDMA